MNKHGQLLATSLSEQISESFIEITDDGQLVVKRYFVATTLELADGKETLGSLSEYFLTVRSAMRAYQTLVETWPTATVLVTHSVFDPTDAEQLEHVTELKRHHDIELGRLQ